MIRGIAWSMLLGLAACARHEVRCDTHLKAINVPLPKSARGAEPNGEPHGKPSSTPQVEPNDKPYVESTDAHDAPNAGPKPAERNP